MLPETWFWPSSIPREYLVKQLSEYKAAKRNDPIMLGMAAKCSLTMSFPRLLRPAKPAPLIKTHALGEKSTVAASRIATSPPALAATAPQRLAFLRNIRAFGPTCPRHIVTQLNHFRDGT